MPPRAGAVKDGRCADPGTESPSPGRALIAPSTEVEFTPASRKKPSEFRAAFAFRGQRLCWPIVLFAVRTSLLVGRIMTFRSRRRYDPDALNRTCRCRKNRAVADAVPAGTSFRRQTTHPMDPDSSETRLQCGVRQTLPSGLLGREYRRATSGAG